MTAGFFACTAWRTLARKTSLGAFASDAAAFVTGADRPLYPWYAAAPRLFGLTPLVDQKLGGVIMWVPAGLIPLVAFTVVFFRWAAAEPDEPDEPEAPPRRDEPEASILH